MHRFYSPSQNIFAHKIILSDQGQVHHIRDVLRLQPKDKVVIFDDNNHEYRAIIEKLSPQSVTLKIKEKDRPLAIKKIKISVACAIPKKSKMGDIIDKLTQLGADRIIPLETERVVIRLDGQKKLLKQKRWQKIALNASQQSQRSTIPIIDSIKDIREVLSEAKNFDLKLIPALIGKRKPLKEVFLNSRPRNILILIGPEGDFTPEEVKLAKKSGCIPVTLGSLVLRVETAAVATVSFIRLYENS